MGHYRSEMFSDAEIEAERKADEERIQRLAEKIQKEIDEKGLARFLAEMRISSFSGTISNL